MARIAAVAATLPSFSYSQEDITAELAPLITSDPAKRAVMARLHSSAGIKTRHTALPLERYCELGSFTETNGLFARAATDLAELALTDALISAGVAAEEVDFLLFTTVTGISAPSIDVALAARLGMRPDLKRLPSFGLGCVAGATGIARVNDYLLGHPDEVAVLVSVELCSLTLQQGDDSMANLVASGLFGDGAAAVVMLGANRAEQNISPNPSNGPDVVASRSTLYPDTRDVIGWNVGSAGFQVVLTAGVPNVILENMGQEVAAFLGEHGLATSDIVKWMAHPGGPRVLEAFETALQLPPAALALSWRSLAKVGNLSSAAALHVLADTMGEPPPAPGSYGIMLALGPGVSAELVLFRWPEKA